VLRTLKSRNFQSPLATTIRNAITARYLALLQERESTEHDLGDLVNAFAELTYFRLKESRVVADRLLKLIEAGSEQGRTGLSDTQISFLMWALSLRAELGNVECRIRSVVLREVGKQLGSIKVQDLVRVAVSLNRMDLFDLEPSEFSLLRQMTDRIFGSITELDERTIYELIRADNTGKLPGYFRIYEEINRNIYAEIDENGESELGHEAIFKVLTHLSDKLPLNRLSEVEKKKFFAFLEVFARECGQDESKSRLVGFRLKELISNNYFAGEQKKLLVTLLQTHKVKLNAFVLYDMAVRDYDISPFASDAFEYSVDTLRDEFQVKLGVIAHRLLKWAPTPEATAYFEAVQAKVAEQIPTPEKFVEYYKRLLRMDVKLMDFNDVFGGLVQQLPNPLETAVEVPNYRRMYLEYTHDAARSREYSQFFAKHEAAIGGDDLSELLFHHVRTDARELEYKRQVVQLVNKRVYEMIDSKNKKWVEAIIDFVGKYSRFVIGGALDINSANSVFRILHCLVGKIDLISELGLHHFLFATLEKYLSKNHKNYNVEHNYRQLVRHLTNYIDKVQARKHHLATTIVREAIRLGQLNKKSLENVSIEKLGLGFFERSRALYLNDNTYAPAVEKVTQGTLEVIFSNHNLENLLVEHEKRIIEIVQNINPQQVCYYLTITCHTHSPAAKRLLAEMLNTVVAKLSYLERVDLPGLFQNALHHNFYHFSQFRKLTEKVVEQFRGRINGWSIETHLDLVRFIISQPGLNPKDYYAELVAFAEKRDDVSEVLFEQILLRLANTNYRFREGDLKYVEKVIKKNPHTGIFFFLMVEPLLEADARSKAVTDFVEKYNANQEKKEQTFSRIYYHYLKKKYPEETAALNIDEKALYGETYLTKPKNLELAVPHSLRRTLSSIWPAASPKS
jgi:hypothetical protein